MPIIGITGGIGTGKSTVSAYIKNKGYTVLDADEMARKLTRSDDIVLGEIRDAFGSEVFDAGSCLDRKKLAAIVFADKGKKEILEGIVTKRVSDALRKEAAELASAHPDETIFLDIPLLFEYGAESYCDKVWLVNCERGKRLERIAARDNMSEAEILARIENQMPDKYKIAHSDVIIDNSLDIRTLENQIERLLEQYARH